jgi:hypothetical protein
MSEQVIEVSEEVKPEVLRSMIRTSETPKVAEPAVGPRDAQLSFDPAMARICIELFARATLYAGAFGLIVGMAAAIFFE